MSGLSSSDFKIYVWRSLRQFCTRHGSKVPKSTSVSGRVLPCKEIASGKRRNRLTTNICKYTTTIQTIETD